MRKRMYSLLYFAILLYLVTSQPAQKPGQLNRVQTKSNMDDKVDYARKFRDLESKTKEILQLQNQVLKSFASQQKEMMTSISQLKESNLKLTEQVKILQTEDQNRSISPVVVKTSRCQNVPQSLQSGMRTVGGNGYFFSYQQPEMSWSDAETFCMSHNMELVSFETKEEWELLRPEYEKLKVELIKYSWSSGKFEFTDSAWKWRSSNTNITFFHADSFAIIGPCVGISSIAWQPLLCSDKLHFVCETKC